jgi:hypothetical protein
MIPITGDSVAYMAFWLRTIMLIFGILIGMLAVFFLMLRFWIVPAIVNPIVAALGR